MIHKLLVILTFVSALLFPWQLTVILALTGALFEPWLPLAAGLFVDTLYFVAPGSPHFVLFGLGATILAFFVRNQLKTSIIEE